MKYLTVLKDNEVIISTPIKDVTLDGLLSCYPIPINPKETIPNFTRYLSQVTNYLYGIATTIESRIEKLRNQEKVTPFSNLDDMTEFYDELTQMQYKLYDLHQEIGKIDTIMNFVFTQNKKEAEWSTDWDKE